ncbi:MAG: N-acetylglucosamine-6-phosphate deacetylase [Oscillospiraceae bacterium]|jgi:N-acetylglucosamine-6-phosphate deacetylase|nr:N-acetylglucosamine-6-phosphate deacetylase [Oscillospiraceae bacterium]
MIIKGAHVFRESGSFEDGDVFINGDVFAESAGGDVIDAEGCYAVPGLLDLHFHGCVGHDFSESTVDEMRLMAEYQAKNGVTSICPATMTLPEEVLAKACGNMAALDGENAAELVGINLEGPFISEKKIGAQNPKYIQKPNAGLVRRLQEKARGLVKLLDLAPEIEGAIETIEELKGEIVCSIAHTEADYDTASLAFARGAAQVTHLFNAMPSFSHRAPGVIGAAFDAPHCRVEMICDGIHLHPGAVRAAFRLFGDERVILISDSMMAAGLDDGEYSLGGLPVIVTGKTARLKEGGAIAGSVTNLMKCVRTAVTEMGIPLYTAVKCASVNPAKAIGVYDRKGSVAPGKSADLVILNPDLSVKNVILRGKVLAETL